MCVSMHEGQNNCVKRSTPGVLAHYVVKYPEFFEDEFLIFKSIMRKKIFSNIILYSIINLERLLFELVQFVSGHAFKSQDLDNIK